MTGDFSRQPPGSPKTTCPVAKRPLIEDHVVDWPDDLAEEEVAAEGGPRQTGLWDG